MAATVEEIVSVSAQVLPHMLTAAAKRASPLIGAPLLSAVSDIPSIGHCNNN